MLGIFLGSHSDSIIVICWRQDLLGIMPITENLNYKLLIIKINMIKLITNNFLLKRYKINIYTFCDKNSKKNQFKLRKQAQEKEQIRNFHQKINTTKGSFNSLTEYFWLYRRPAFSFAVIGGVLFYMFALFYFGAFQEVFPNSNVRQWNFISNSTEDSRGQKILSIFLNQFQVKKVVDSSPKGKKLSKLKQRAQLLDFVVIQENEYIVLRLPCSRMIISSGVLSNFNEQELYKIVILHDLFYKQRLHVKNLSIGTIKTYLMPNRISNEMRLRQIYTRPYKQQQIKKTLMYLSKLEMKTSQFQELLNKISKLQTKSALSLTSRLNTSENP